MDRCDCTRKTSRARWRPAQGVSAIHGCRLHWPQTTGDSSRSNLGRTTQGTGARSRWRRV